MIETMGIKLNRTVGTMLKVESYCGWWGMKILAETPKGRYRIEEVDSNGNCYRRTIGWEALCDEQICNQRYWINPKVTIETI
jgi:hypothetical protein|tara:strand:- start:9607 stop:9852 length:246 start_codon:yes stop_codon:yes gene_type:complete